MIFIIITECKWPTKINCHLNSSWSARHFYIIGFWGALDCRQWRYINIAKNIRSSKLLYNLIFGDNNAILFRFSAINNKNQPHLYMSDVITLMISTVTKIYYTKLTKSIYVWSVRIHAELRKSHNIRATSNVTTPYAWYWQPLYYWAAVILHCSRCLVKSQEWTFGERPIC